MGGPGLPYQKTEVRKAQPFPASFPPHQRLSLPQLKTLAGGSSWSLFLLPPLCQSFTDMCSYTPWYGRMSFSLLCQATCSLHDPSLVWSVDVAYIFLRIKCPGKKYNILAATAIVIHRRTVYTFVPWCDAFLHTFPKSHRPFSCKLTLQAHVYFAVHYHTKLSFISAGFQVTVCHGILLFHIIVA